MTTLASDLASAKQALQLEWGGKNIWTRGSQAAGQNRRSELLL